MRLAVDWPADPDTSEESLRSIAKDLGIQLQTLVRDEVDYLFCKEEFESLEAGITDIEVVQNEVRTRFSYTGNDIEIYVDDGEDFLSLPAYAVKQERKIAKISEQLRQANASLLVSRTS